jgi:ATP-binding cassette subfamily F protein 3
VLALCSVPQESLVLSVQHLHHSYGSAAVLADVSFTLRPGERVGLVGPNGSGKSTLLRCLAGREQPEDGRIVLSPPDARLGYLPQATGDDLAAETAGGAATVSSVLAAHGGPAGSAGGAWLSRHGRALGLERLHPEQPVSWLSGGQKTRLGLAALLLDEPALLLLDEPTNHLDLEALRWLEQFLVYSFRGSLLVVSHDRTFLDATVQRILYLDPEQHTVSSYPGGYSDFAAAREHERDLHAEAWRRQQDYVSRVRSDVGRLKSQARSIENSTTARQPGLRKFARKKAALAKAREHKLDRYLAADDRVERPTRRWPIHLDFGAPPPGGRDLLRLDDVSFAYSGGPPVLQHLSLELRYGQRLAISGPNGAGKSTLLKLIGGQLQPTHGRIMLAPAARVGLMVQEHETLAPNLTVLDTVLRERPMSVQDARDFLPAFLFWGDSVFKQVSACSLGERSRLQLACLVLRGCNLLLLDEPINHLDVESRVHFEAALQAFEGSVIIVAHDRAFLHALAGRTIELKAAAVDS